MTLLLYNLIWKLLKGFVPNYLNYRVNRGKEEKNRILERYGISPKKRNSKKIIWLHGSSVGESVAAIALANSMLKNDSSLKIDTKFLITTNTVTSAKYVNNKIKQGFPGIHQYHPYDYHEFVKKFLIKWKPDMAIFLESDFWPNLIYLASVNKIPTILASSQMSKNQQGFGVVWEKCWQKKFLKTLI